MRSFLFIGGWLCIGAGVFTMLSLVQYDRSNVSFIQLLGANVGWFIAGFMALGFERVLALLEELCRKLEDRPEEHPLTYYDFRNNTPDPGLLTDCWLVHASGNYTDPTSWAANELRLTSEADGVTGKPFDMEQAPLTSQGYFLGDYQGLVASGSSFYALFAQAGTGSSDPSNIWFRDPPPAPAATTSQLALDGAASSPESGSSLMGIAGADLVGDLGATDGRHADTSGQARSTESAGRSAASLDVAVKPSLADLGVASRSGGIRGMADLSGSPADLCSDPLEDMLFDNLDSTPTN
jgi:hypothetical protein